MNRIDRTGLAGITVKGDACSLALPIQALVERNILTSGTPPIGTIYIIYH